MNLSFEQWIALMRLRIALIVSLIGLVGLVYKWNRDRPIRKVKVSFVPRVTRRGRLYRDLIEVTFINKQGPVVMIEEVGFERADGERIAKNFSLPGLDDPLPKEVPPGHSGVYYFNLVDLGVYKGDPIPVRAYCRDATDQYHKTPLYPVHRQIRSALGDPRASWVQRLREWWGRRGG